MPAQVLLLQGNTCVSTLIEDDMKRWTATRKTALTLDIIQGQITVAEYQQAVGIINTDAANIYKTMNFDPIEEYAETVKGVTT
jgi:aconitase B